MNNKKNISFDFDGTLDDEFDGCYNIVKEEIQSLAKKYVDEGNDVCIITKRFDSNNRHLGKVNEHLLVYELAKELGITKIYFTNREMKFSHIIKLGIEMHFENSEYEVQLINQACKQNDHKCVTIHVENPNWREFL
jgi:phosphoglycolate phosphatase-like HAD superfamily hydrolase